MENFEIKRAPAASEQEPTSQNYIDNGERIVAESEKARSLDTIETEIAFLKDGGPITEGIEAVAQLISSNPRAQVALEDLKFRAGSNQDRTTLEVMQQNALHQMLQGDAINDTDLEEIRKEQERFDVLSQSIAPIILKIFSANTVYNHGELSRTIARLSDLNRDGSGRGVVRTEVVQEFIRKYPTFDDALQEMNDARELRLRRLEEKYRSLSEK
jgi:hypothetical protein